MLVAAPAAANGQAFLATQPKPEFEIGPLSVRANVGPATGPIEVSLLFSLVVPASVRGGAVEQSLYLLWPGEVDGELVPGAPDPELRRTVEGRGVQVTGQGPLPLTARAIYSGGERQKPEPIAGRAPVVTYTREAGPLGTGGAGGGVRV